jgi:hypothetical protein
VCGSFVAARLLGDIGDISRFAKPHPVRVLQRHRPDRRLLRGPEQAPALPGRDRRINQALHIMTIES